MYPGHATAMGGVACELDGLGRGLVVFSGFTRTTARIFWQARHRLAIPQLLLSAPSTRNPTVPMNKYLPRLASVILAASALTLVGDLGAQEKKVANGNQGALANQLIGTWVLVGPPGTTKEAPEEGGRLQFFTGKHWLITQADPQTKEVIFHHGGTYTLDGDQLEKRVEYANKSTATYIGNARKFKITVDGDTYTQIGLDNQFNEVWKRVK